MRKLTWLYTCTTNVLTPSKIWLAISDTQLKLHYFMYQQLMNQDQQLKIFADV